MKSIRDSGFFSTTSRKAKKSRIDNDPAAATLISLPTENLLDLPDEIWLEILKNYNKKELCDVSLVTSFFPALIAKYNLFQQASWPRPNYNRLVAPLCRREKFNRLSFDNRTDTACLTPISNGDVVAGTEDGRIEVLKLGRSQWQQYGQHRGTAAPRGLRNAAIHFTYQLPSGLLTTCGDDGIRLWNTKTNTQVQFLSVPESEWPAQQNRIHALPNGDLITSSTNNQFYLWKKTLSTDQPYQYSKKLFDVKDDDTTKKFHWQGVNNTIIACSNQSISYWDFKSDMQGQHIETERLKHRLALHIQNLCDHTAFVGRYLQPSIISCLNNVITHSAEAKLNCHFEIPHSLIEKGYIIAEISIFKFLVKPFDENMQPIYLGYELNMKHVVTINNDLIVARTTTSGVEVIGGFDATKNTFQLTHLFSPRTINTSIVLNNGHVLVFSHDNSAYVFDLYSNKKLHDLMLELPDKIFLYKTTIKRLASGELLGWQYSKSLKMNWVMIWDYYTGKLIANFLAQSSTPIPLANGDILSHSRDKHFNDEVSVVRFGLKK